jgi:uncharacterized protein (DUF58 family)
MATADNRTLTGNAPNPPAVVTRSAALPDPAIVALALAAIVAALFGLPLLAILASLIIAVTVLARVWTRFSLEGVTYACTPLFRNVMEGEAFDLALTVENNKPLPVPWLHISQFLPRGFEVVESDAAVHHTLGGLTLNVDTNLGGYERLTMIHRLRPTRRGHYTLAPALLAGGDLFGFYDTRRPSAAGGGRVVVFPRIVPLPGFALPSARPVGDAVSRRQVTEDQNRPATVREYVPGDPMKWIDWKTTARKRRLHVKRYEPSINQHVVILLECRTGGDTHAGWSERQWLLDAAASAAASVAYRASELGYGVGLVANGIPPSHYTQSLIKAGHGAHQLSVILQALACVQSAATQPLETLIADQGGQAIPFGATIVFVAGTYHRATVQFVRTLPRYGHRLVTIDFGGDRAPAFDDMDVRDYRDVFASAAAREAGEPIRA